jgi:hypothetical protein
MLVKKSQIRVLLAVSRELVLLKKGYSLKYKDKVPQVDRYYFFFFERFF